MNKTLLIKLNETVVGYLTHYKEGKNSFIFDERYIDTEQTARPILSLSFNDFDETYVTRHRLPSFFSNLLPEGELRSFIASQLNIHIDDEFSLLSALGHDLPGAIIAENMDTIIEGDLANKAEEQESNELNSQLHFSLAGVQIKFSMLKERSWFTLTKNHLPGDYIVKTPSMLYPQVPENEYSMMKLAEAVGITIPEVQLIQLSKLKNLPAIRLPNEEYAYAIKRFDRNDGERIHMEDFAQVFNIKPQEKYQASNYETMAKFIYTMLPDGNNALIEFLRRIFFNMLIGNTDAHLKNWSILYKNAITPSLAPAYDLVSTLPYLNNRGLALNFSKQKNFYLIDKEQLIYFSKRTNIPEALVLNTAKETVEGFKTSWKEYEPILPVMPTLKIALKEHWKLLPLYGL